MENKTQFPILSVDLQIGFHYRLKSIKDLYFHEALKKTVRKLNISSIDSELKNLVSNEALQRLASFSLRGEVMFPLPILLNENPYLLGYYRLLLGFSQKEFYSKGPFGLFKSMEVDGKLSERSNSQLISLCQSLISSGELLLKQIDDASVLIFTELQLLTIGPQFRGSKNNELGQIATQQTFSIIKDLVSSYIEFSTLTSLSIKNDSRRTVKIQFSSDPDIEIKEDLNSGTRGLISIEIKGGRDYSNIHNRIGEAEKSHQKAKLRGYSEFMTIISVDIDYDQLRKESPTTTHFFQLDLISDKSTLEFRRFKDLLSSILSISI